MSRLITKIPVSWGRGWWRCLCFGGWGDPSSPICDSLSQLTWAVTMGSW
jgi:hypothetical protein